MQLHEAISIAINLNGVGVLTDSKLINILADLQAFKGKEPIVKRVLSVIVNDKLLGNIAIKNNIKEDWSLSLSSLSEKLDTDYGYRREIIDDIIHQVSKALSNIIVPGKTEEDLSTKVTDVDIAEAVTDEFGVLYSPDGKRLLMVEYGVFLPNYKIKEETKVIFERAFQNCSSLQNIIIPNSIKCIGERAFAWCESLHIIIPSSVTHIEGGAFIGSNIEIKIESEKFFSDGFCLIDKTNKSLLSCHRKELESYRVPKTVIKIDKSAFFGCDLLYNISIPNSIKYIENKAFYGCRTLQNVVLPNSVTYIGDGAFSGCNLKIQLNSRLFFTDGCCLINLATKRLLCCHNEDIQTYSVLSDVKIIGEFAFSECYSLQSILLPDSITAIEDLAFYDCTSLQSIKFPSSITHIGKEAFWECESLQNLYLPENITYIGDGAFYNCKSIQYINIPNSITRIEKGVFSS